MTEENVSLENPVGDVQEDSNEETFGTLADVQKQNTVPTSRGVLITITDVEIRNTTKEGNPANWKTIALQVKLNNGIIVEDETQFKGKVVFDNVPYYASPSAYDYGKPYFKNNQHIVKLKSLIQALDINPMEIRLIKGGVSNEIAELIAEKAKGKQLTVDILEKDQTRKNDEGKRVPTGEKVNELKNFVTASDDYLC